MLGTTTTPREIGPAGKIDTFLSVKKTVDGSKLNLINSDTTYRLLRFEKQTIFKSKWIVLEPGDNILPFKNKAAKTAEDEFLIFYEDGKGAFIAPSDERSGPVIIRPPYGN